MAGFLSVDSLQKECQQNW